MYVMCRTVSGRALLLMTIQCEVHPTVLAEHVTVRQQCSVPSTCDRLSTGIKCIFR